MADEEALLVVVGVDEPAGDAVGAVAVDFACVRVEDIDAVDFHAQPAVLLVDQVDIRLAEDDKEIALAGCLEVFGHVQVGIHARLEHGDAAQLTELGGVRLVVERAGNEHVEPGIACLAGGRDEVRALHCAELRTDENGGTLLGFDFQVTPFAADQFAGPRSERSENDLVFLVGLLHAGDFEVL